MKHLKDRLVREGSSDKKLWDAIDKLKEAVGADQLLDDLCQAMSDDELRDNLKFIIRNYDMNDEIHI